MTGKQQLINFWLENGIVEDENIIKAFLQIPRDQFIPPQYRNEAYHDHPLPTIRNQSISQPTTIMLMLKHIELKEGHNVFEVGAGAGYQAALISKIIGHEGHLVTSEVIPELVQTARYNLKNLAAQNVKVIEANGGEGLLEKAPYDRIIITAACPAMPTPLVEQLKEGGIILAPIGDLDNQTLVKGTKEKNSLHLEFLGSFKFVPMKGKQGFHGYSEK